jgi:hypothetical protein
MKTNRIILSVFTVFITIFSAGEGLTENKLEEAKKDRAFTCRDRNNGECCIYSKRKRIQLG